MRTLGRFATVDEAVLCYARWSRGLLLQISARPSCQRAPNTDNAHADACALTFVCVCVCGARFSYISMLGARLGRTDCNVFRVYPPSRPLGSPTPTQPGRVTNPTRGVRCGDSHDCGRVAVGRPPWPRALVHTGCALRDGQRLNRFRHAATFVERTPCLSA